MAPTPDPSVVGLAEETRRQMRDSAEAQAWRGDSNMMFQRVRGAFDLLRQAYVLCGIFVTTFALYPFLAASFLLNYRQGQRAIPNIYHRLMRGLLGLKIATKGSPSSCRPLLLVSNHTSWLDIIVMTSFLPVVFVAKQEVASWPFFGWLAKLQRSIFVHRDRRHLVHQAIDRIADALLTGEVIGLFPEGTSTDGTDVVSFRSALIGGVHETLRRAERLPAVFVQPVAITYVGPNRKLAVWAREDETPFFAHLLQVAGLRRIDVTLTWGELMPADMSSDRKALAKRLEETVRRLVAEAHESDGPSR
jgi:1-acyl-sn-glycerol-3-phosphate acyltransferase